MPMTPALTYYRCTESALTLNRSTGAAEALRHGPSDHSRQLLFDLWVACAQGHSSWLLTSDVHDACLCGQLTRLAMSAANGCMLHAKSEHLSQKLQTCSFECCLYDQLTEIQAGNIVDFYSITRRLSVGHCCSLCPATAISVRIRSSAEIDCSGPEVLAGSYVEAYLA